MAIGDVGMFLPSEGQFKAPRAYSTMLEAEATKRANYLAQMDQFYAQLEEAKREFDVTTEFKGKQWEEELGFKKEALAQENALKTRELDITEENIFGERETSGWFTPEPRKPLWYDIEERKLGLAGSGGVNSWSELMERELISRGLDIAETNAQNAGKAQSPTMINLGSWGGQQAKTEVNPSTLYREIRPIDPYVSLYAGKTEGYTSF